MRYFVLLILAVSLVSCSWLEPAGISEVIINDQVVEVSLASRPEELSRGLAGVKNLADNQGMLFIFPKADYYQFWMKDMLIPLDIIWLNDRKIVDITTQVPAPQPGQSEADLPLYSSSEEADYVLELPAGWVRSHQPQIGQIVEFR